jgi:TonB-dependent starch-binding outer membrane protein SusC
MKLPRINQGVILLVMRISLSQILLMTLLVSLANATSLKGQEALQRKVSINVKDTKISEILFALEEQALVSFTYQTELIDENKISLKVENEALGDVLTEIFGDTDVTIHVNENEILLKHLDDRTSTQQNSTNGPIVFSVSGKIVDETGQPLPGVNILEKGTTNGTTSDADGAYVISVSSGESVLIFSFIGYASQEIPVKNKTVIDVSLVTDIKSLEEVVVVGYGVQKKINMTGAVGAVKEDFIKDRPITDVSQALSGGVSGVFVNQNSGQPGEDGANIRIRGIGTLNNTNPFILVDGIEAPINQVDPNDIASITVLKDAASASIYGSRASNGVILITTKRGNKDSPPTISYSGFVGSTEATILPKMVTNSAQFMELKNEANANSGVGPSFTQAEIDKYRISGPNTNWMDEFFNPGSIQSHNISINGGGSSTNYLFSVGNLKQTGISPGERYDRYNVRLNLDTKVGKKIAIGASIYLTTGNQKSPEENLVNGEGGDGVMGRVIGATPLFPVRTSAGQLAGIDQSFANKSFTQPFLRSEFNTYTGVRNQLLASSFVEYEVIKNLKVKGTVAVNYQNYTGESFARRGYMYDWVTNQRIEPAVNNLRGRNLWYDYRLTLTAFLQADYTKSFNNHNIHLLAGYSQENSDYQAFGAARNGFLSNSVMNLNSGSPASATNYENQSAWAYRSFFGRINYDYKGKYLFEANLRRDGSSRFGAVGDKSFGNFPSVSAGWVISNEQFLADYNFIDLLKLRASWGQLGNSSPENDYPGYGQVSLSTNYASNGSILQGSAQATYNNFDMKWETTTTTNVGLAIGLLQKFTIDADYFIKNSKDILFKKPVPQTAGGLPDPLVNTAEVRNEGWELAVNYNDKFGEFTLGVGFNVTNVDSKILVINPDKEADKDQVIRGNQILKRGEPINSIYGLKAIGIFQNQDEINNSPAQGGSYGPGDLKFADIVADGVIDNKDRTIIGREDPKWLYGINLNLGFKGFDLSAVLNGVSDFQSYGNNEFYEPFFNNAGLGEQWTNRWTPTNPTDFPRLHFGSDPNFARTNSFWVQDRSYLRLRNIQLGYNLPSSILTKIGIKKLRIYVNGQNLFTSTNFLGFDPERVEGNSRGGSSYPVLKIISGGVNLSF